MLWLLWVPDTDMVALLALGAGVNGAGVFHALHSFFLSMSKIRSSGRLERPETSAKCCCYYSSVCTGQSSSDSISRGSTCE